MENANNEFHVPGRGRGKQTLQNKRAVRVTDILHDTRENQSLLMEPLVVRDSIGLNLFDGDGTTEGPIIEEPDDNETNVYMHMTKHFRERPTLDDAHGDSNESTFETGKTAEVEKRKEVAVKKRSEDSDDTSFYPSTWPNEVNSYRKRSYLIYDPKAATASYSEAMNDHCFVCDERESESSPLMKCKGNVEGIAASVRRKCKTVFHMSCLEKYNAGDYWLSYVKSPESQGEIYCPLHFCDACYISRKKQSAFEGKLVECAKCYRSFHPECLPAGSDDFDVTIEVDHMKSKGEMLICPSHIENLPKFNNHFGICCECESADGKMMNCDRCVRSFHPSCRKVVKFDGGQVPATRCESCLHHETIRHNRPVIATFRNKKAFYPCYTRYWDKYPNKKDKFFSKPGYTVVQWAGYKDLFGLVPITHISPMFSSSFELLCSSGNTAAEKKAWREMCEDLEEPFRPPPFKEVRKKITTSVYVSKELRTALKYEFKFMCSCDAGEGRCGDSFCSNRATLLECPEDCERRPGGCSNRNITNKIVYANLELKKTEDRGYGVFATARIPKGTFIAEYAGELINSEERDRRQMMNKLARDSEAQHYMLGLADGKTVDAKRAGNIARYANHSCAPNCRIEKWQIVVQEKGDEAKYDTRAALFTSEDINQGDELTFNYQMEMSDGQELPQCLCGSANCIGNLRGANGKELEIYASRELTPVEIPRGRGRKRIQTSPVPVPQARKTQRGRKPKQTSTESSEDDQNKQIILSFTNMMQESAARCMATPYSFDPTRLPTAAQMDDFHRVLRECVCVANEIRKKYNELGNSQFMTEHMQKMMSSQGFLAIEDSKTTEPPIKPARGRKRATEKAPEHEKQPKKPRKILERTTTPDRILRSTPDRILRSTPDRILRSTPTPDRIIRSTPTPDRRARRTPTPSSRVLRSATKSPSLTSASIPEPHKEKAGPSRNLNGTSQ